MFGKGAQGYVIAFEISVEIINTDKNAENPDQEPNKESKTPAFVFKNTTRLRYTMFFLDLQAETDQDNDFIYWEFLSIYDVDIQNENPSIEEIIRQKLTKTKLTAVEYQAALKN